jgi:hypothetical protein
MNWVEELKERVPGPDILEKISLFQIQCIFGTGGIYKYIYGQHCKCSKKVLIEINFLYCEMRISRLMSKRSR